MNNFDNTSNFTWTNATTNTGNFTLTGGTDCLVFTLTGGTNWHPVIPDKNWMPYKYFEYEPRWHQKFARYKLQMENMWN